MRQPDTRTRLQHMRDAAREARSFANGRERTAMDTDRALVLILTRLLEIIGEAASTIPGEFRSLHPEIPWRDVSSMRNRLIHAYHDINADVVWGTVTDDLVPLIAAIERILADEDEMAAEGGLPHAEG